MARLGANLDRGVLGTGLSIGAVDELCFISTGL